MPYNNTAIPPSDEVTGTASLPLARVKKILQADDEIGPVSNNAAFVITLATEMFVRHLAEQAHNMAKTDVKPRRNIQYKDVAKAVARFDNLEFLTDIIPQTTTMRDWQAKKARESGDVVARKTRPLPAGQTTLDGTRPQSSHVSEQTDVDESMLDVEEAEMLDRHAAQEYAAQTTIGDPEIISNGRLVFEHYEPNGRELQDESGEVDMV